MESARISSLGRDTRASRLIIVLLSVGFAALLAAALIAFYVQRQNEADAEMVAHTLAVEANLGAFASATERMETARRGLILTQNPAFATIMDEAEGRSRAQLAGLEANVGDNPQQGARVAELRAKLDAYARYYRATLGMRGADREALIAGFANDEGVLTVRSMRAIVETMLGDELSLLKQREARQQRTQRLFTLTLIGTFILLLVVAAATLALVRRNLVDLRASRQELRRLNEGLEDLVDARTGELQRANAEIQRFAYIVSHDLRSPLVNVMGFTAELETARKSIASYLEAGDTQGWQAPDAATRLAIEEDLPESIGFIRTSTQKMDRLINAILNLSRQGRRTLAPETLDLSIVVGAIVESLQHRIDETGTEVTVADLPTVINDRVAVEQILSNLVENALKYLKPGLTGVITISGGTDLGRAWVSVCDNGRGIEARDHQRIFDLFRRSGVQDQQGEGIGLAHARALAYRLGGNIEVQSELGVGSTFRLILPLVWQSGEEDV
ncbi:signal transduction histidine kinase [Sphingopyxis sp. OAS728]|uniref:sensor histidine kinase n=1 Tax=Sphingopyxis sp. OAS728 TaxID=2663823 RepID=UPI00178ADEAC|nr:sensor histidine kinase [Sphingopyxis sp. OAS728]MBE1529863.1 signal transduction histidine kinase [Sphingopyxis sp. OAS728]